MTGEIRRIVAAQVIALGCAACTASSPTDKPPPAPTESAPSSAPAPSTVSSDPVSSGTVAASPTSSSVVRPTAPPHEGPLAAFHDALRELEAKTRTEHVRILWLGDSHAQADFWPDAIRRGLQKRFGHGGPGFIHFGMKSYRHAGVKFDIQGGWRMRPKMPSTVLPWGDGAFGLGGILHAGFSGYRSVSATIADDRLATTELSVDLCYKPGLDADDFTFEVTGEQPREVKAGPIGEITHLTASTRGLAKVRARIKNGRPDFCGLVLETQTSAGVVLDNLGINGARWATPLAWNETAWASEVARRPPQLVIMEYGGNEASDGIIKPQAYKKDALALIARVRRAAPDASCLVIGPSDRADAEQRIPPIVEVVKEAAAESSCFFWNTYDVMGGRGSLAKWRDDNRAAPDGVHLKPNGYAEVGALMLQDLMKGYTPR